MKEILLTSSVLILAVTLLRTVFQSRVSARLRYALWGLVLLRLLIPVQFGSLSFSVTSLAQNSQPIAVIEQQISAPIATPDYEVTYQNIEREYETKGYDVSRPEIATEIAQQTAEKLDLPTWEEVLKFVWLSGMLVMAVWFIAVNLRFRRSAQKGAVRLDADSPVPVYVSSGVTSPCLTGLFRPVIFLTPAAAADERLRRHVLTHELTHYRHGDHIWSLLRSLCLCVYWFHPLVWIAAILSRRDCELACDEGVLQRLGESERISYGKSLLDVVAGDLSPAHLMEAATAMNESKRQLTERVNRIVKKPKFYVTAAICLFLAASIIAGCTFAGNTPDPEPEKDEYLLLEAVTQFHAYDGFTESTSWTRHYYNDQGHLTAIANQNDNAITSTEVVCNENGNPARKTQTDEKGTVITLTEYTYDADGNELTCKITTSDGFVRETSKTYDNRGNLTTLTDTAGNSFSRIEYKYDRQDRLTRVVTYVHDEEDRREEYSYSKDGLTATVVIYDGAGTELGKTVKTVSADGRSAEVVMLLADGTEEQRSTYVYDEAGNCIFEQVFRQGQLKMTIVSRYMKPGEQAEYMLTHLPGDKVCDAQLYPFPGTTWGMTPDQVIKTLGLKEGEYTTIPPAGNHVYHIIAGVQTELFGISCEASFAFEDTYSPGVYRLNNVTVTFSPETDFDALLSQMTLRYGAPEMTASLTRRWSSPISFYDLMTPQDRNYVDQLDDRSQQFYKDLFWYISLSVNGRFSGGSYQGELTNNYILFSGPTFQFSKSGFFTSTEEPTEPSEPLNVPQGPQLETLVTTGVETHLEWNDDLGNQERFDARIPQLYPFSEDAIAINQHITEKYGAMVAECEDAASQRYSSLLRSIDYEAYLNGSLLSLVITTETTYDYTDYEVYNFWIADGETVLTMDTAAMAKSCLDISYVEYLYGVSQFSLDSFERKYADAGTQVIEEFKELYQEYFFGMPMGHNPEDLYDSRLFLDGNGQIMLLFNDYSMAGADFYPTVVPISLDSADKTTCYDWLFNMHVDGTSEIHDAYEAILLTCHRTDTEAFNEALSRQSAVTVHRISQLIEP